MDNSIQRHIIGKFFTSLLFFLVLSFFFGCSRTHENNNEEIQRSEASDVEYIGSEYQQKESQLIDGDYLTEKGIFENQFDKKPKLMVNAPHTNPIDILHYINAEIIATYSSEEEKIKIWNVNYERLLNEYNIPNVSIEEIFNINSLLFTKSQTSLYVIDLKRGKIQSIYTGGLRSSNIVITSKFIACSFETQNGYRSDLIFYDFFTDKISIKSFSICRACEPGEVIYTQGKLYFRPGWDSQFNVYNTNFDSLETISTGRLNLVPVPNIVPVSRVEEDIVRNIIDTTFINTIYSEQRYSPKVSNLSSNLPKSWEGYYVDVNSIGDHLHGEDYFYLKNDFTDESRLIFQGDYYTGAQNYGRNELEFIFNGYAGIRNYGGVSPDWSVTHVVDFQGNLKLSIKYEYLARTNNNIVKVSYDDTIVIYDLDFNVKSTLCEVGKVIDIEISENLVITTHADNSTKIWNLFSGKLLATKYQWDNDWVAFTPNGMFDGTSEGIRCLHYVQGFDIIPLESFFEEFFTPQLISRFIFTKLESITHPSIDVTKRIDLPPRVRIISPVIDKPLRSKHIRISVEVKDQGGGIDEIRLFHNGRLISEMTRGMIVVPSGEQTITQHFDVQLIPGINEFRVTAFNKKRIESIPAEITIYLEGAVPTSDLYIIAVGINEYKNPRYNLNYGRSDAEAFVGVLKKYGEHIFRKIETQLITDKDATRERIEKAFNHIKQRSRPEDTFIFYYAGHGTMSESITGAPPEFYLALHDVTWLYGNNKMLEEKGISSNKLRNMILEIQARKQLVVLDACYAGGAIEVFAYRGVAEERAIYQLARSAGVAIIASTESEQFATEFEQLGHGVFTYALLQGLRGEAALVGENGRITVSQLRAYIERIVPELAQKYRGRVQYPIAWIQGQDFPIGVVLD